MINTGAHGRDSECTGTGRARLASARGLGVQQRSARSLKMMNYGLCYAQIWLGIDIPCLRSSPWAMLMSFGLSELSKPQIGHIIKWSSYRSNNCNAAYIPRYEIQLPVITTRKQILCRRDVGNHKMGSAETFFLAKASYTLAKKKVAADPIL